MIYLKVTEVACPPQLGEYYLVPTVKDNHLGDLPVLFPFHADKEWGINHYHIDFRFLEKKQYMSAIKTIYYSEYFDNLTDIRFNFNSPIECDKRGNRPNDHAPTIAYKRLRMVREYPLHLPVNYMTKNLVKHIGTTAPKGICPCCNFDLNTIQPQENGYVVCPMHGLVFKSNWECVAASPFWNNEAKNIPI